MTESADPRSALHLRMTDFRLRRPDGRPMFDEISADLNSGELMIVQGPNGVGKSTLLRAILGLWRQSSGRIELTLSFDDEDVSYLPQQGQLQFFLPLTLGEVVELGEGESRHTQEILKPDMWDVQWDSASGGERQKALLTRLFRSSSRLFLLDEPFNHLDHESTQALWAEILASLGRGASVLLVAHGEEHRIPVSLRENFPVKVIRLRGRNLNDTSLQIVEASRE
jgi:ABC-type Mn2+/Zn2+ transport system ATPase subunit